jgi:hypothetical protein
MDMVTFFIKNEPDHTITLRFIKAFPEIIVPYFENEMKEYAKKKKTHDKFKQYEQIQELIDNSGSTISEQKMQSETDQPEFLKKYVKKPTKTNKLEESLSQQP